MLERMLNKYSLYFSTSSKIKKVNLETHDFYLVLLYGCTNRMKNIFINWIHTLILTHVSDVEASEVGAVVRRPSQQQLVARGGHIERRLNVATE